MKQHRHVFSKILVLTVLAFCLTMLLASCGECDHQWGEWTVSEAPSCETAGSQSRTCSACGETQSQSVAATGHHFGDYVSCGDATCQSDGTEIATCAHCDTTDTRTEANSKNPDKHTTTELRYESRDDETHKVVYACCGGVVLTEDHRWDNGATDPNNAQNTIYTCQACGKTRSDSSAHEHSAQRVPATAAGCSTEGNIEHWYCEGCNTRFTTAALTQTISEADTKIPAAHTSDEFSYVQNATDPDKHDKSHTCCGAFVATEGHSWDGGVTDPDNAQNTIYTCQNCGKTKSSNSTHEHSAQRVPATAAGCTTEGNIEHWYCEGCNTRFTTAALTQTISEADTKIPAAHTSQEFTYVPNATDTTKHDKSHACCGAFVATEAHDHKPFSSTPATCEQSGTTLYRCACGASYTIDSATATGHNVTIWNMDSETLKSGTTCTYNQTFTGVCLTCGETETKSVETTRHTYVATVTAYPTCKTAGSKSYACECGATPDEPTVTIDINSDAHRWDGGVTVGGVTTYTCLNGCEHTKTAVVYTEPTQAVDKSVLENNEIVLGGVSLRLDQTTLGLLGDDPDQEVTVVANPIDASLLPESIRNQLPANTPIYDFGLSQGGVRLTQFEGGRITITLPYELPEDADADCVSVWYVNDDGELSFYAATYYETEDGGFVIFEASHFSTYLPGLAPSADACELYGHNYETKVTAPTCDKSGYTEYHCQRCGESKIDDITDALGHSYDSGTGTEPTCTSGSTMVFSCTRQGCEHTQEMTIAPNPHNWQYVAEESTSATCTEEGVSVYCCGNDGCTAKKTVITPSFGGHDLYEASAKLADGATSCEDGVVITKKCYHSECQYTETETVTGTHVRIDKLGYDESGNFITPETKIMLGDYLDELGIAYTDEPYISLIHGCFCGELKEHIQMFGGTNQYGEMLFSGSEIYISAMSPSEGEHIIQTQPVLVWNPDLGYPVESPVFKIRFLTKITRVGCLESFTVTVQIGYDSTTGAATETLTYKLYEEVRHMNIKTSATIDDPSKTCFESSTVVNGILIYGIHVTEYCADCQTVTNTFDTAVSTSSSHYFYGKEVYEYDCESGDESYYGVRVFINECPCGQVEYTLYRGDCSFTSTTVGNTKIYTCRYCGYIYATRTVEVQDVENCRYTYTEYLYLNCESADDVTNCEKTVICRVWDEERHYHVTNENNREDPTPTDISCRYYTYSKNVCDACGETTYFYEGYVMIHDLNTTTSTDSRGNVTTTEVCRADGCGYQSIVITDKNGNILRDYSVDKDYSREELCVSLSTWKMANGIRKETFERNEYYSIDGSELLRWAQWTYTYRVEAEKGCICTVIFTNHEGAFETSESFFCQYDEYVYQDKTCQQDGYSGYRCSVCGNIDYHYYDESRGHEYYEGECIYCHIDCEHEYDPEGFCPICCVYCRHESYTDSVCDECGKECHHDWWNEGVCEECGTICTHDYDDWGWCLICGITCSHEEFTDSVCDECGMICEHNGYWYEGVCEKCGTACDHDYEDSWCRICGKECGHDSYTNGICTECGRVCQHWWDNGICERCGIECDHKYDDYGWCQACSKQCGHSYTDGTCTECGRVCQHWWDNGVCGECGSECDHEYHGGVCDVCCMPCGHEYDEYGWCVICGMPCSHDGCGDGDVCGACGMTACFHSWSEGACEKCGTPCNHDYQYGICNICYKTCQHEAYTDSVCDECGTRCEWHSWVDGACERCGTPCQHGDYDDGMCRECGEECEHEYVNGRCGICDTLCSHDGCSEGELCGKCGTAACFHDWSDGVCGDCGVECPHKFQNGECIICAKACEHNYLNFGSFSRCDICDNICHHEETWGDDGVCDECGAECNHYDYVSGACSVCGKACDHDYRDNWCMNCGALCPHNGYSVGETCGDCGATVCSHEWHEGTCVLCWMQCNHTFLPGSCSICGMQCFHHFMEGVCDTCGEFCDHNYQYDYGSNESWCENCYMRCWHENSWVNGVCDVCGFECQHPNEWNDGVCGRCGKACEHEYDTYGECITCHKRCWHERGWNDDGLCNECGMECRHEGAWDNGVCGHCGKECEHDYQYGSCRICRKPCDHEFGGDNVCDVCNLLCEHTGYWEGDTCNRCGAVCAHERHSSEGVCNICYTECGHSYFEGWCEGCSSMCEHIGNFGDDNVCDVCGTECRHEGNWCEGFCGWCGTECEHQYEYGYCYICGKMCEHIGNFGGDNVCDVCGAICEHNGCWYEGVCEKCGTVCGHDGYDGSDFCYTCGKMLQYGYYNETLN